MSTALQSNVSILGLRPNRLDLCQSAPKDNYVSIKSDHPLASVLCDHAFSIQKAYCNFKNRSISLYFTTNFSNVSSNLTMACLRAGLQSQSKFPIVRFAGFENLCNIVETQTMPELVSALNQLHANVGKISWSVIQRPILHSQDTIHC
jgi:hypothetical protein